MNEQNQRSVDYIKALSDLLKIGNYVYSSSGIKKVIDWINKYATTTDFQTRREGRQLKFIPDEPDISSLLFPNLFPASNLEFKSTLQRRNIQYIDEDFCTQGETSFIVSVENISKCVEQAQTIADLYLFVKGGSIDVTPISRHERPLLPSSFVRCFKDFLPLKDLEAIQEFMIDIDDLDDLGISEEEMDDYKIYSSCDGEENGFDIEYRDYFEIPVKFDSIDSIEIHKHEPYGDTYFQLAIEIICKYLEKCSSPAEFYGINKCPFVFDQKSCEFREIRTNDDSTTDCDPLGFYNIHHTLARCILEKRLLECSNCCKPFIAKRNDAKTCSQKCRNHRQNDKRKLRRILESQDEQSLQF